MLDMEGLPVHVIVAVPLVVVGKVVRGAVMSRILVGVGRVTAHFVITLGVGVGA